MHFHATYDVFDSVGFGEKRSRAIAYYSQYPDIDLNIEAVHVAAKSLFDLEWRSAIMSELHSLHGGGDAAIIKRRNNIREALKKALWNTDEDWLVGLLLHAYADSFAHVRPKYFSKGEVAYGDVWGHLWPSLFSKIDLTDSPDDIHANKYNKEKYRAYIEGLYTIFLETNPSEYKHIFEESREGMLYSYDNTLCEDESCVEWPATNTNITVENAHVIGYMACMSSIVRPLTKEEVLRAVNLIKNGPSV